jgi:hypothetical protein
MNLCPFFSEELHTSGDQKLRSLHVAIGNRPDNLGHLTLGQVDLHNRAGLRDMHMRGRVVEGVDPNLEPLLPNQRWHSE